MTLNKNRIQVMVSDEILEALKQAAKAEHRTVSDFVRVHLLDILDLEES